MVRRKNNKTNMHGEGGKKRGKIEWEKKRE
jgi:hypothetical protein